MKVRKIYLDKKDEIQARLKEFSGLWKKNKETFAELVFCLLTPQSKARVSWETVLDIKKNRLLWKGSAKELAKKLNRVRFKNNKAKYICAARKIYFNNGFGSRLRDRSRIFGLRDWLVKNIKGLGYKEASHFLRNIGLGQDLAILDRHILKNIKSLKIIDDIPSSLSRKRYLGIEDKMRSFSKRINIPMDCLDLVLWYKETGEIFK